MTAIESDFAIPEDLLPRIVEHSPIGISVTDYNGRYVAVNPAYCAMYGYTQDELLGNSFTMVFEPEKRNEILARHRRFLDKGGHLNGEWTVVRRDGSRLNVLFESARLPGVAGRVHRLVYVTDITGRKTAEQALLENESRFRLMTASIRDYAIVMLDIGGRIASWNEGAQLLHGFESHEVIDQPFSSSFPEAERLSGKPGRMLKMALAEGRSEDRGWCMRKDGSRFYAEVVIAPVYRDYSELLGFIKITRDITQHRENEELSRRDREQQSTLRELLETTLSNGSLEDTLRICLEKLMAISWLSLEPKAGIFTADAAHDRLDLLVSYNLAPDIRKLCARVAFGECHCGLAAASGAIQFSQHVDAQHLGDHQAMDDHGHYALPLSSGDKLVGVLVLYLAPGYRRDPLSEQFLASVADILAGYLSRKASEQALIDHQANLEQEVARRTSDLREAEENIRLILDATENGIMVVGSGRVAYVNRRFQEILHMPDSVLAEGSTLAVRRHVLELVADPDRLLAELGQLNDSDDELRDRVAFRDGRVFERYTRPIEIHGARGRLWSLRDITDTFLTEQVRKKALDNAERLARARSIFLANMSHEIRTPLNAILGLARIGVRDGSDRKSLDNFGHILVSANHLLELVNDVLDFSKIEAGKLNLEKQSFRLATVVDEVIGLVMDGARNKSLALSVDSAGPMPEWLQGDPMRLKQILLNLLSNAVKFTERGAVTLRLDASRDGKIDFQVVDTGIGMTEEQALRIFEAFEQADNSTTRKFGGTGLGLVISRNLARLMEGDITVQSTPGRGSTFTLSLPLPQATPGQEPALKTAAGQAGNRLQGIRILAADDVDINRLVLDDLLGYEGADVVFAHDGSQVLERLGETGADGFDVVLMDVQMPVMDGLEATRRLGRIAPTLPVIGLTAHALAEEREKCLAAGMVAHITKPIDIDQLVGVIRHFVGLDAAPAQATAVAPAATAQPPGERPGIDLEILAGRVGHTPARLAKYVRMFLENAATSLEDMRSALEETDLPALAALGHRMKSGAYTVGAMSFGDLCRDLEACKADDDARRAGRLVGELETLLEDLNHEAAGLIGP